MGLAKGSMIDGGIVSLLDKGKQKKISGVERKPSFWMA